LRFYELGFVKWLLKGIMRTKRKRRRVWERRAEKRDEGKEEMILSH
jgi:hypothetical protein